MTDYLHGYSAPVRRSHSRRTAANSAAYLLPALAAGQSVLDVGCGVGTITADLARIVAPGRVVGLDSSAEILETAASAAAERGVQVELAVGDALALPFPDDTFDVVHLHQVLQHLPDPVAALREARRVVRPGGVVAARDAVYATVHAAPEDPALDAWRDAYRAAARRLGVEPDAGAHLPAWARAAGFAEVVPSASVWLFATPEDRGWWAGSWADRTHTVLRERLQDNETDPMAVDAMVTAWRTWGATPDAWMAMTHGEVLLRG